MSILLDALKKSERERQLGKTPTLGTGPDEQTAAGTPSISPLPVVMALLSALVIGWLGWKQFQLPAVEQAASPIVETREETPQHEEEAEQPRTMTELYGLSRRDQSTRSAKPPEKGNRAKLSKSVSDYTAENAPQSAAQAAPEPAVAEDSPADITESDHPGTAPSEIANRDERRKGIEPHVTEPISYWELPQGVRDELGEIKITVLVYAQSPDDRFLLSNGQRLVEKDEIEGGLVLDEIRQDGAVFLYRNYRFLVKG